MNYTSVEQSKKLLKLGLSPESADMYWAYTDKQNYVGLGNPPCDVTFGSPDEKAEIIPCWSVGALLELMPLPRLEKDVFPISEQKNFEEKFGWECITYGDNAMSLCEQWSSTKIDVCYNMVIWLLENNYIKQ